MQETAEKEINEIKFDHYMPITRPIANKAYQLIKWYEKEILGLVVFTIPDKESRERMDKIRGKLKDISCRKCEHLGQLYHSELRVKVLVKDELLSKFQEKLVLVQETQRSKKKSMACEGCVALKLKQVATGYIKGRKFKQI